MGKFNEFIDRMGQAELARALGVSRTAVYYWRNGSFRPEVASSHGPSMVQRIMELSEGELKREDIRPDVFGQ